MISLKIKAERERKKVSTKLASNETCSQGKGKL